MGLVVRTTDNGWSFGVVMLSDQEAPLAPTTKLGEQAGQGTARVSNAEVEAKR